MRRRARASQRRFDVHVLYYLQSIDMKPSHVHRQQLPPVHRHEPKPVHRQTVRTTRNYVVTTCSSMRTKMRRRRTKIKMCKNVGTQDLTPVRQETSKSVLTQGWSARNHVVDLYDKRKHCSRNNVFVTRTQEQSSPVGTMFRQERTAPEGDSWGRPHSLTMNGPPHSLTMNGPPSQPNDEWSSPPPHAYWNNKGPNILFEQSPPKPTMGMLF